MGFEPLDLFGVGVFVVSWIGYHLVVESPAGARRSLNGRMDRRRVEWMLEMTAREVRIVDTTIMASLQNGAAFFASTSLIAIGGALALLQSTDAAIRVFADLPFTMATLPAEFEVKAIGLAVIFAYAFFKFAWSYRLFNYAAILMGATPPAGRADEPETRAAALRCAAMTTAAGRHFNRGQRAFFFALAYLGWFLGPIAFVLETLFALAVMWRRQYGRAADEALGEADPTPAG